MTEPEQQSLEDALRQLLEQTARIKPLVVFSFYLSGRVDSLLMVREEILGELDAFFEESPHPFERLARGEMLLWLWSLGAYEVVRTMCQADVCFSPRLLAELTRLKKILAQVRMPAAKMEKPGKKVPVGSGRNPCTVDFGTHDLVLGDPAASYPGRVRARELLAEFARVFGSIESSDVLRSHEASYEGTA